MAISRNPPSSISVRNVLVALAFVALFGSLLSQHRAPTPPVVISSHKSCDVISCAPVCAKSARHTEIHSIASRPSCPKFSCDDCPTLPVIRTEFKEAPAADCPTHVCPHCPTCEKCADTPEPATETEEPEDAADLSLKIFDLSRQIRAAQAALPTELLLALKAYQVRHEKVLQELAAGRMADEKFLVYTAGLDDGYGNRLPGLVTGFVWALLTNRIFLTEWRDDKTLMPEPAPFGKLFAPGFDNALEFDMDVILKNGTKLPRATVVRGREVWEQMSEDDLEEKFSEPLIKFYSDDWLYPLLTANPHYADTLRMLFPHGRAFNQLGSFLLPLAPALQDKLDDFREVLLPPEKYVIGLHLRLQKVMPDDQGRKTIKAPPPELFFETARLQQLAAGIPNNSTVYYVATETQNAVEAARTWFGERGLQVVFLDDRIKVKRKEHRDAERGSLEALQNAIVELKLLSLSDSMVGTFASSYSYVSSSWGNIIPTYIMPDGRYWHAGISEPCFRHASRGHAAKAMHLPDIAYHTACSVSTHRVDVVKAERGKDGRLKTKEAKSAQHI